MTAPDRSVVLNAFRIVPHAVGVDDARAGSLGYIEHQAIDMRGHATNHVARRRAEALWPIAAHQLMVAADAARRDDHRLRAQCERAHHAARTRYAARGVACLQHLALDAIDDAAGPAQSRDAITKTECDEAAALRVPHAAHERLEHARPGPPCHMKPRHRIDVTACQIAAALRPADDRENSQALLAQPRSLFASGKIHI